jgi:hypothetical protein
MPESNLPQTMVYAGVALLVAWRVYKRFRRMVGRQKMNPRRAWTTVVLFPTLIVLLSLSSIAHPMRALALLLGVAVGIALGIYGLRVTRFEVVPEGHFYTPSAHLGIALSMLLVGRLAYRFVQLGGFPPESGQAPPADLVGTPLTLVLIGMLAAYYVTYAIGLIRWHRRSGPLPESNIAQPPVVAPRLEAGHPAAERVEQRHDR